MENYTPRLKERYRSEIVSALTEQFGYDNVMQVPRLTKIVVNKGVGEAAIGLGEDCEPRSVYDRAGERRRA